MTTVLLYWNHICVLHGVWATYGFLYFYITKEDLAARRFDRIWLIFQCD